MSSTSKNIPQFKNVIEVFLERARELSDRPCMRFKTKKGWETLDWKEVQEGVQRLASVLWQLGLKAGDRVAILANTRHEWTLLDAAILSAGGVTVPIYQSSLPREVEYILGHSGAKLLFVENKLQLKKIQEIRPRLSGLKSVVVIEKAEEGALSYRQLMKEVEVDVARFEKSVKNLKLPDLATIVYTSGTTGQPKGAALTHLNLASEVDALRRSIDIFKPDHEALFFLPLAHILARAIQFYQLTQGFVHVYAESIDRLFENIQDVRPHFMVCVPRIFEKVHSKILGDIHSSGWIKRGIFYWAEQVGSAWSERKQKGETISWALAANYALAYRLVFQKIYQKLGGRFLFFISGGAPLSAEIARFFHAAGLIILEGYGLTETMAGTFCNRPEKFKFGTVGPAFPYIEAKIASDGEIFIKGLQVFQGYYQNEEATREAFTSDGYFKTGDIGEFDADGYLKITDRKKDLIVTAGGKNIAPQPIENLIKTDPLVSQVMVHGDRRKFLSALLTLNEEGVKKVAQTLHVEFTDYSDLIQKPQIVDLIRKKIDEKNKQLPSYETIKRFAILAKDFSVEGGELTPSLKVKRKVVTERYLDILDGLYNDQ